MGRRKVASRPELIKGGYSAIPWIVLDSVAFQGATDRARALLFPLMRQHNGQNNGHLHLAKKWLYQQGFTNDESNRKAKSELIERGLIVHTKQGGLNMGADLFALTWYPITNFVNLDIDARNYKQGTYTLCKLPPTKRRSPPVRKKSQPVQRASTSSPTEPVKQITGTTTELVKGAFSTFTGSTTEHNVITPLPTVKLIQSNSKKDLTNRVVIH